MCKFTYALMLLLGLALPATAQVQPGMVGAMYVNSGSTTTFNASRKGNLATLSSGNTVLTITGATGNSGAVLSNTVTSGKKIASFTVTTAGSNTNFGVLNTSYTTDLNSGLFIGNTINSWGVIQGAIALDGKYHSTYGGTYANIAFATGDVVDIAVDDDNGFWYIRVNGVWWNSSNPTSGATGTGAVYSIPANATYYIGADTYTTGNIKVNSTLVYPAPAGYTQL